MKSNTLKILTLGAACISLSIASAQELSESTSTTTAQTLPPSAPPPLPALPQGQESQRLVSEFAVFSGSQDNAVSLVSGLRNGTAVSLSGGTDATGSMSFDAPTGPMGWGEIQRALTYARSSLAAQGITQPTPEQLKAALVGGTLTTSAGGASTVTTGVLQLRSQGMGWGQIAHTLEISPSGRDLPVPPLQRGGAIVTAGGNQVTPGTNRNMNDRSVSRHGTATASNNRNPVSAMGTSHAAGARGHGVFAGGGLNGGTKGGGGQGLGRHR